MSQISQMAQCLIILIPFSLIGVLSCILHLAVATERMFDEYVPKLKMYIAIGLISIFVPAIAAKPETQVGAKVCMLLLFWAFLGTSLNSIDSLAGYIKKRGNEKNEPR